MLLQRLPSFRALIAPAVLASLVLPVAFGGLAVLASAALSGTAIARPDLGRLRGLALPLLLFGPLPEELAWRGFALPAPLEHHRPLTASLILAALWALWHLPLFFVPGTYQATLG